MAHTIQELATWLHLPVPARQKTIAHLVYDARRIVFPEQSIFIALSTGSRDGHQFIDQAYSKGVRAFLVHHSYAPPATMKDAIWLAVEDPLKAMQLWATRHRELFHYPVVGITGSNGKTTTKEWMYQLLSPGFSIVRTPRSYNSQIGVPLSVWEMAAYHQLALFEAGISQPGEMEALANIMQPTIGVFTTIGPAHDEGFNNRKEKIREKLLLFQQVEVVLYCRDHSDIHEGIQENIRHAPALLSWGYHTDADLHIMNREVGDTHTGLEVVWQGERHTLAIPFVDEASIENAMHTVLLGLHLQVPWKEVQQRLLRLHRIPMRLELKQATNNSLLVFDCYNSDLKSLQIALDFQERHKSGRTKTVILSDILQSGLPEKTLYQQVAAMLRQHDVHCLIGVGPAMMRQQSLFDLPEMSFYPQTPALIEHLAGEPLADTIMLLKGARSFAFEDVAQHLEEQVHNTVFEIRLDALAHNLKVYQQQLPAGVQTMAMVKAFSYGAGSHEIAGVLAYHNVNYLAVAYTEEGVALRQASVPLPIMVINPDRGHLLALWQYHLEPVVYSMSLLKAVAERSGGRTLRIHIKLDTGMHRLGLEEQDLEGVIALLQQHPNIEVASIFSHLVGSDNPDLDDFTHHQAEQFKKWSDRLVAALPYAPLRHLLNSGGIVRFPEYAFDMVRLGLGLYGLDTTASLSEKLMPVGRLITTISQLKMVPKGASVGYGRATVVKRPTLVATVSLGYADGYRRAFSQGRGHMLVHGQPAPVLGNVCMDMTMIDVTDIPSVREGDAVEVFGDQLPVERLAQWIDTIPYEIIAGIDQRVKRVYLEE